MSKITPTVADLWGLNKGLPRYLEEGGGPSESDLYGGGRKDLTSGEEAVAYRKAAAGQGKKAAKYLAEASQRAANPESGLTPEQEFWYNHMKARAGESAIAEGMGDKHMANVVGWGGPEASREALDNSGGLNTERPAKYLANDYAYKRMRNPMEETKRGV